MTSHVVKLPSVGEITGEVMVLEWYVGLGDRVTAGRPLLLVETDKTEVEIPSPVTGILSKIHADVEAEVVVGDRLATIEG